MAAEYPLLMLPEPSEQVKGDRNGGPTSDCIVPTLLPKEDVLSPCTNAFVALSIGNA